MRLVLPFALLLLAGCDSAPACKERGGSWESRCVPSCTDVGMYCNERAADSGKACTDFGQCIGECEALPGAKEGDTGAIGRCCELERCFPALLVVKGTVEQGGIP